MAAKSVLDVGVGGFDAVIEGNHLPFELGDEPGGDFFPGQAHRMRFGGRDGRAAIVAALRTPASPSIFVRRETPLWRMAFGR